MLDKGIPIQQIIIEGARENPWIPLSIAFITVIGTIVVAVIRSKK